MYQCHSKNNILTRFVLLSCLAHLSLLFPLGNYGFYHFARPVALPQPVIVSLDQDVSPAEKVLTDQGRKAGTGAGKTLREQVSTMGADEKVASNAARQEVPVAPETDHSAVPGKDSVSLPEPGPKPAPTQALPRESRPDEAKLPSPKKDPLTAVQPPLRTVGEFTGSRREKLSYRISMLGMPIGTAELEAKNDAGELRITLTVKSTPALSAIYPVDDLIEVRHLAGNFIITKIRQQEGTYKSNRGFTIFLRDKRVFWMDLLRNRSLNETIPNDQVLDLVSAFYYLRNRPLEVGRTESLHVYDSDTYSLVPVDVLRREQVSLPLFRKADALVVSPRLKTDGIFRRTGEVTIWLTDDEFKVPVRMETAISLGHITAELVSAAVDNSAPTKNSARPFPPPEGR